MTNNTFKELIKGSKKPAYIPETVTAKPLENPSFAPMLNGTATNRLAVIGRSAKPTSIKTITDNATIEKGDFKVFIEKYSDKKSLKVGTIKLLDLLAVELAKVNHFREKDTSKIQTNVTFSLDDYMGYLGIPNPENPVLLQSFK